MILHNSKTEVLRFYLQTFLVIAHSLIVDPSMFPNKYPFLTQCFLNKRNGSMFLQYHCASKSLILQYEVVGIKSSIATNITNNSFFDEQHCSVFKCQGN